MEFLTDCIIGLAVLAVYVGWQMLTGVNNPFTLKD